MEKGQKYFDDIGYFITYEHTNHYNVLDFVAYKINGTTSDGKLIYNEATESSLPTYNIEEAQPYLDGFIRSDGCSNWDFCGNTMIHFCERDDYRNITILFDRMYDIAKESMGEEVG